MTLREVLGAIRRRWYILVMLLTLTVYSVATVSRSAGVYSTRTAVSFTFEDASPLAPYSGVSDESVIAFAGAIAADLNERRSALRYSSMDAPYYGAGIRKGVLVALQDDGSQWSPAFSSATIEIQIVGPTEQWVRTKQAAVLKDLELRTTGRQDTAQVAGGHRIRAQVEPLSKRIDHVMPGRSSILMSWVAAMFAAVLVGAWLCVRADGALAHMRRRKHGATLGSDGS